MILKAYEVTTRCRLPCSEQVMPTPPCAAKFPDHDRFSCSLDNNTLDRSSVSRQHRCYSMQTPVDGRGSSSAGLALLALFDPHLGGSPDSVISLFRQAHYLLDCARPIAKHAAASSSKFSGMAQNRSGVRQLCEAFQYARSGGFLTDAKEV